jgi:hypothetical protein
VSVINGTTVVGTVNVGNDPEFATYDGGNGYVYVPNYASDNVSVLMVAYRATFMETGLPSGAAWWINVTGGPSTHSTGPTLSFNESYGTYYYSVSTTAKNYSSAGSSFRLAGMPLSVGITFSLIPYPATFTETGLPAGTNWSVTLSGVTRASNATTLEFQEPNGTHAYHIGVVSGWRTGSYTGAITVRGAAVPTTIPWSRVTYQVTFAESGLPSYTEWWVNVTAGRSTNSVGTALSFSEPNGTYAYSVATLDKEYSARGGSFALDGSNASETVAFSAVNYTVTFTETGLPSDTGWWINLTDGPSTFSTGPTLSFNGSNGTYAYSASTSNANYSSPKGSLAIKGGAVFRTVAFSLVAYTVTFTESGLPAGRNWLVILNGTKRSGTEDLAFLGVRNGTYGFTIGPVVGYAANRTSGTVTVQGGPASAPVTFAQTTTPPGNNTSPATFLGLPAMEGYAVLGGIIAALVVVVAVAVLLSRRRKAPPEPAKTTSRPDAVEPPASP